MENPDAPKPSSSSAERTRRHAERRRGQTTLPLGRRASCSPVACCHLRRCRSLRNPPDLQIYRFWRNIFAMSFGIAVVNGLVLSFEFGLGFARFAQVAGSAIGPIIGPALFQP